MLVSATDDRIRGMMRPGPLPTEEKQLKGCIWRSEAAHPAFPVFWGDAKTVALLPLRFRVPGLGPMMDGFILSGQQ